MVLPTTKASKSERETIDVFWIIARERLSRRERAINQSGKKNTSLERGREKGRDDYMRENGVE
jgi:hypothetical protein